jgi:short-subunit dehydrogenase
LALAWETVWITGASTGIGRRLALDLAAQGVRVAATARSVDKLADLAGQSPNIVSFPADVTVASEMTRVHAEIVARFGRIDLAVLNAGVWDPMGALDYGASRAAATMAVNYAGITNALEPLIPPMIARRGGHIAIVASVAGYRGLPMAASYAPSKAAAISLAEVLHLDLARHGVKVSIVNPGFVDTPMTVVNRFPMPFMVPVEEASRDILHGLAKSKFEVAFPWPLVMALKFARVLPYPLYFWFVRNVIAPGAEETRDVGVDRDRR